MPVAPLKSRGWVFTINNPTPEDTTAVLRLKPPESQAVVAEYEVGEDGTRHIQGAVYFTNARTLTGVKRKLARAHLEIMHGSWQQASDYCRKSDEADRFVDVGEVHQGKRTDIIAFVHAIKAEKTDEELLDEFPVECVKYWGRVKQFRSVYNRKKYRKVLTKGLWLYGPTAVGKSHRAFTGFDPLTHYVHNVGDKGWWDGYDCVHHKTVIINDFRGEINYAQLLNLVDKWPMSVSNRGNEPYPFLATKVIITSSTPPDLIFKNRMEEDNIAQMLRRFEVIEMFERTTLQEAMASSD